MPQVVSWPHVSDARRAAIDSCVRPLLAGGLVAMPTEALYVAAASGLRPEAVARLAASRGHDDAPPLAVALRGAEEVRDWVPAISALGLRLARRCWPGPMTLVCPRGGAEGVASRLPEGVHRSVCPGGVVAVTVPHHAATRLLLECVGVPVVFGELPGPAATADDVRAVAGEAGAVLLDDGPTQFGRPATVVEVDGATWRVTRPGVYDPEEIARQTARLVVFVCTGNTCRSPMAEAVCKALLAQRLDCPVAELPGHGFVVVSAGLAAPRGEPAAAEAAEAVREYGGDLSGHATRPVSADLLAQADDLIAMTVAHRHALAAFPGAAVRARLLCDGGDLADPVGGDRAVYRECAATIRRHVERLVDDLLA